MPFVSLELLEGGSLCRTGSTVHRSRGRSSAELLQTLALAVVAAHQAGIIHRDLKPSNVLFTDDGTPKVTDFGLASAGIRMTVQTRPKVGDLGSTIVGEKNVARLEVAMNDSRPGARRRRPELASGAAQPKIAPVRCTVEPVCKTSPFEQFKRDERQCRRLHRCRRYAGCWGAVARATASASIEKPRAMVQPHVAAAANHLHGDQPVEPDWRAL